MVVMVVVMVVRFAFFGFCVGQSLSESVTSQQLFATRLLLLAQCTSSYAAPYDYRHPFHLVVVVIIPFGSRQ